MIGWRKFSFRLFVVAIIGGAYLTFDTSAEADQAATDQQAIKAMLAEMDDPDEVKRELAAQAAINSSQIVLRSLALKKALASDDGIIRELGYNYLIKTQKRLVLTIDTSDQAVASVPEAERNKYRGWHTILLEFQNFDERAETFCVPNGNGLCYGGTVSQSGIQLPYNACTIRIDRAFNKEIRGNLACGPYNFAATAGIP